jgi:WD40 repeat protein
MTFSVPEQTPQSRKTVHPVTDRNNLNSRERMSARLPVSSLIVFMFFFIILPQFFLLCFRCLDVQNRRTGKEFNMAYECFRKIQGAADGVWSVVFSKENKIIAGSVDGSLKWYDVESSTNTFSVAASQLGIVRVALNKERTRPICCLRCCCCCCCCCCF